jgi:hypothetical protein
VGLIINSTVLNGDQAAHRTGQAWRAFATQALFTLFHRHKIASWWLQLPIPNMLFLKTAAKPSNLRIGIVNNIDKGRDEQRPRRTIA